MQGNVHYALVEMAIGAEVNGSLSHSSDGSKKGKDKGSEPEKAGDYDGQAPVAAQSGAAQPQVSPFKS